MELHPKILELKSRASAINYGNISVSADGKLINERASDFDKRIVAGYAVLWGQKNLYDELFIRGCFAKSIKERGPASGANYEIKFLNQHDPNDPLSLFEILEEDETGLYFRTKPLDDVPSADRVLKQLRSGTLNNYSQGFNFVWDKVEWDDTQNAIVCKEAELYEISVASIPVDQNSFTLRSLEGLSDLNDDTEYFIKQLPRKSQFEARQLFARHKSLINLEPLEQRKKALESNEPTKNGIDYNYLIKNI